MRDTVNSAVESDLVVLVDKLARVDALPERDKDVFGALDVVVSKTSLERLGSLPGVVVGDLARDVVKDVSLSNTVEKVRTNRTEPVAVNRAKSATREGPCLGLVVRKSGVGVLEVGDHYEPVVAPQVRNDIVAEDVRETALGEQAPGGESAERSGDTNVGNDNLHAVTLVKDNRIRVKVVREFGVVELTRGVPE